MTYADAVRRLTAEGLLEEELAARAVGFRNLLVHPYADLDLSRAHAAAVTGPADLRAFAAVLLRAEGVARG